MHPNTEAPRRVDSINQRTGTGWALMSIGFAAPWLVALHGQPWVTFYNDWLMAVAMVSIVARSAWLASDGWPVERAACAAALLAVVPLCQALTGRLLFGSDAVLAALHLTAVALAITAAYALEARQPDRVADTLFSGLLVAGLLSTGLALYQRLDLNTLGVLVAPLPPGGRPVANVGQPNHLSTLLVWSLLGVAWGFQRRRIAGPVAVIAAAYLLLGIAATQSRTGIVAVVLLAAACSVARHRLSGMKPRLGVVAALIAWFVAVVLAWPALTHALMLDGGLDLAHQAEIGRRPLIWRSALAEIIGSPWAGHGWNQGAVAQQTVALEFPPIGLVLEYAHNIVLDLLVWNGVPIGLAVAAALLVWFALRLRALKNQADLTLWLMLAVLLLHSMLELPHAHMMFLLPAALAAGVLARRTAAPRALLLNRWLAAVLACASMAATAVLLADYTRVESDMMAVRMRAARIGDLTPAPVPEVILLHQLQAVLAVLRIEPATGMEAGDIDRVRRVALRYPSAPNMLRLARVQALNGSPQAAARTLDMLCHLARPDECKAAGAAWRALAATDNPLGSVRLPPSFEP